MWCIKILQIKSNVFQNVPATGQIMWVNLEKKAKVRRQGIVRVKVNFSSEKNSQVAIQEHRHLLRIFAIHEIDAAQVCITFSTNMLIKKFSIV